jgi:hypothetical protein
MSFLGLLGLNLALISAQALAQAVPIPVAPPQMVKPSSSTTLQNNQAPDATQLNKPTNQITAVEPVASDVIDSAARDEILKTFQREARAAYAEAQTACKDLRQDQQAVCLAKARIQFDEDMQYAQKRANMGF